MYSDFRTDISDYLVGKCGRGEVPAPRVNRHVGVKADAARSRRRTEWNLSRDGTS